MRAGFVGEVRLDNGVIAKIQSARIEALMQLGRWEQKPCVRRLAAVSTRTGRPFVIWRKRRLSQEPVKNCLKLEKNSILPADIQVPD